MFALIIRTIFLRITVIVTSCPPNIWTCSVVQPVQCLNPFAEIISGGKAYKGQKLSRLLRYHHNRSLLSSEVKNMPSVFSAGPGHHWGSLQCSPDPLVGWGNTPSPFPTSFDAMPATSQSRRLGRWELQPSGPQILMDQQDFRDRLTNSPAFPVEWSSCY